MRKVKQITRYLTLGLADKYSIKEVAKTLINLYGANLEPEIANKHRAGDIKRCFVRYP